MILAHATAVLAAVAYGLRQGPTLGLTFSEWRRLLRKSINCGVCYVGLGTGSAREGWRAGLAGFLSTAFDAATDWRGSDASGRDAFVTILAATVSDSETRDQATAFLDRKRAREFADDGLERGVIALRLILRLMERERQATLAWGALEPVGRLLQIVDDVLDLEWDAAHGEMNCLLTPRAPEYLAECLARCARGDVRRWFGSRRTILVRVVEGARVRAERLSLEPRLRLS